MALSARDHVEAGGDVFFLSLDTLRLDVAVAALDAGETPHLAALLGPQGWEARHTPGSFTFAAHQAFFAGFLPTPVAPGPHPRLFAAAFHGSETIADTTAVFDAPTWVQGLSERGYRTICVGGTGFFNPAFPLGRVLPGLFDEAHWSPDLGVTNPSAPVAQVGVAVEALERVEGPALLFLNSSAMHQPNCHYVPGLTDDTLESHRAALAAVDASLPPLLEALRRRGPCLCVLTSDHGTCYGEDGYTGHRVAHPVVWTVPFAARLLEP